MGQLTTRRHLSRNEREMVRAVTSQIQNIDQAAAIVKGAISEVGHLHATAARIASSQVQITEQDLAAGYLMPFVNLEEGTVDQTPDRGHG